MPKKILKIIAVSALVIGAVASTGVAHEKPEQPLRVTSCLGCQGDPEPPVALQRSDSPQQSSMTPVHFWTWSAWTLLVLNLITEAAVLWLTISCNFFRRLIMLAVFAGFCLLADVTSIIVGLTANIDAVNGSLWLSRSYWLFYWGAQIIAGIFVFLLALQIITVILPPWDRLITLLGLIAFSALAAVYLKLLPTTKPTDVLTVVTLADLVTVLSLPIIWVVKPSAWPQGMKLIAAGLVVSLTLQAGCTALAAVLRRVVGIATVGIPLSALIGMGFFLAALLSIKTGDESRAHSEKRCAA